MNNGDESTQKTYRAQKYPENSMMRLFKKLNKKMFSMLTILKQFGFSKLIMS